MAHVVAELFGAAETQVTEQFDTAKTQVTQQITHSPRDGDRRFDLNPLLSVIEDISNCGILSGNANVTRAQALKKETFNVSSEELKMIRTISCEISCNCTGVGTTTDAVVKKLSSYSWDAQLVIALASFAVNYGEFCLAAQLHQSNPLAKSVGLLKQLQSKLESVAKSWKSEFETLIKVTLRVTKCIQDLKQKQISSIEYIDPKTPLFSTAISHASTVIYPAIRCIVICAKILSIEPESQTTGLIMELSSWKHTVNNMYEKLEGVIPSKDAIETEIARVKYQKFVVEFQKLQVNVDIVNALIDAKDPRPLLDGSTGKPVSVDVLKGKEVLLLISDLSLSDQALSHLVHFYEESRKSNAIQYEVVWVHVAEYSSLTELTLSEKEKKFKYIQNSMRWYSVREFSFVNTVAVRYIKEECKFNKEPLFVKLSPSGGVGDIYPIRKVWLWGNFIASKPRAEETWNIEQLAGYLIPSDKIEGGKYICLYGGEDKDWIQSFTDKAKDVAKAANIQLEMMYVGKSNFGKVSKTGEFIKLGETVSEQSMTLKKDPIMCELMRILYCFDGSHQGWAVISEGSANMAQAKGDIIVKCLDQFDSWKADLKKNGFVSALNGYIKKLLAAHHCVHMVLPSTITNIPEIVCCPECLSPMERFNMYRCCT